MGSMRERPTGSGRWQLRVYLGGGDYASDTFTGTRREATRALARLEVAADDQRARRPSRDTVAAFLEEWWSSKAWESTGARRHARGDLDRYLVPQLGAHRLTRLTEAHVTALYRGLQTPGPGCLARGGRPLGPATIRRLHVNLHSALNWAVRKGKLGRNPASLVDVPAHPPTRVRGPDPDELRALLAAAGAGDPDFAAFVRVAAATGRRRQDILALTTADLRPEEPALVFDKRAVLGGKGVGVVVESLDKNYRTARVDVDGETMAALTGVLERRRARAALVGATWGKRSYLFSDDVAGVTPWRPDSTSREFRLLRDRAGLPDTTLHGLRHAHVTGLLEGGLDVEAVAKRVGDDPATIYKVYAHARRSSDRRAAAIMGGLLDGAASKLVALDGGAS